MIGDFGVPIAIFIMTLADNLIKDTYTQVTIVLFINAAPFPYFFCF